MTTDDAITHFAKKYPDWRIESLRQRFDDKGWYACVRLKGSSTTFEAYGDTPYRAILDIIGQLIVATDE